MNPLERATRYRVGGSLYSTSRRKPGRWPCSPPPCRRSVGRWREPASRRACSAPQPAHLADQLPGDDRGLGGAGLAAGRVAEDDHCDQVAAGRRGVGRRPARRRSDLRRFAGRPGTASPGLACLAGAVTLGCRPGFPHLVPPGAAGSAGRADAAPAWGLRYFLQATDDLSLLIPAEEAWKARRQRGAIPEPALRTAAGTSAGRVGAGRVPVPAGGGQPSAQAAGSRAG